MFALFIGITLIIQTVFFQKFYVSKKRSGLKSNIEKFKKDYNKDTNNERIVEIIDEYEGNYNIKIVILNNANELKLITKPTKNKLDITKLREITEFIKQWIERTNATNLQSFKKRNETVTLLTQKRKDKPQNIIVISSNNERDEIIFALASLQPIDEAVSVIEELYKYFSIGAVFFIVILAFIYSNMITKPLIEINKVATKMAKLDFSEKCNVKSEDEIGNMASSLNFLSENLNEALTSLKEANVKLEEDIEKERKMEKARREFVAAVSHELKTPISLIDGYAMALKDNIFGEEEKDYYLDIIIDEGRKMGSLVNDMLDLSNLESGSFKLTREEFDICNLIKFTLKKYKNIIKEKAVKVELNLLENIMVYADWNRIEQVITNFITNALRHVNENGTIYVGMIDKGNTISIGIENTGSRIPEEELSKIWDKFYKVDKSRNRKLGGTGLGLSIVKNILTAHRYSFGVENTDRGVKFYFIVKKM
ncbi:HAMP domain-containing protein [Clostridium tetanomorphum]|uniref:histidine kinase n=3 Tax=Clostridium tetanomorphum TaxID=1553 RepID=A0A923ECB4_CLOTT|nr:HAMP domain-containing sensor histidine kinase [Clostridium tetanomorphum]MBC2397835.1 HAMP domain-containing protein [Clostridium tetanomorphum]